jgi:hypothetical protein
VPTGLRYLVNVYKTDRDLNTTSAAIRELLETHPEIAKRAAELYDVLEGEPPPPDALTGEV